jgi:hypothetical protein
MLAPASGLPIGKWLLFIERFGESIDPRQVRVELEKLAEQALEFTNDKDPLA